MIVNSHSEISVNLPVAREFSLSEAYPNPFNPVATLTMTIPEPAKVLVQVYNIKGEVVSILANGFMDANIYTFTWDASNLTSGIYFVKAEVGEFVETRKLTLIK